MEARARIIYHGRVQGVFFRANCQKNALSLGLSGWARNRSDGSVESVVEGAKERIEAHIEWNRTSQPHAEVEGIEVDWEGPTGELKGFHIR